MLDNFKNGGVELKRGDWVNYDYNDNLETGYVLRFEDNGEFVVIRNTSSNKRAQTIIRYDVSKARINEDFHKEELNTMIDLALQTGDNEWLKELSSKISA